MRSPAVLANDTSPTASVPSLGERIGLVVDGKNAAAAVRTIVAAEAAGVRQVWMIQLPSVPDILTTFAAAAVQTTAVRLGTAVIPTYPRHPFALAKQALALSDLAPGRLRLGIGPSHRVVIEGVYGLSQTAPLEHLREYLAVLRAALWEGQVQHQGRFFSVVATLPRPSQTPLLVSALRAGSFRLAGEIADGAITWLCPLPYILQTALPTVREAAARTGRSAPPLVTHTFVALSQNHAAMVAAARQEIQRYSRLPFYANMLAVAGFPEVTHGELSERLIETVVISGDETTIATRLTGLLAMGIDELLVALVPVLDPEEEHRRLMHLIGQL